VWLPTKVDEEELRRWSMEEKKKVEAREEGREEKEEGREEKAAHSLGWFVKHRQGCKGSAVRYSPSATGALTEALRLGGFRQCVVQREVAHRRVQHMVNPEPDPNPYPD